MGNAINAKVVRQKIKNMLKKYAVQNNPDLCLILLPKQAEIRMTVPSFYLSAMDNG
jgi:hypothetical protein